ncbi:MAG: hypothetical protein Fur0010_19460 [Bdellovibrio sp.]
MGNSLKDALMKVGLRSTKTENERLSKKGREVKLSERHQETRNYCENCNAVQPDVERYKHRSPFTDAEWICSACADKLELHDKFRVTQQSEFAKNGRFRREYGPTLDLSKQQTSTHKREGKPHHRQDNRDNRDNRVNRDQRGPHKVPRR